LNPSLRTNRTGGKTVRELIAEAARQVPFMTIPDVLRLVQQEQPSLLVLDVRDRESFAAGHLPGARNVPRGELELRADGELADPTVRILTCCKLGKIFALAAAALRSMGYTRIAALDGGIDAWTQAGHPLEK
jgi:rhodanese-related sulfurtransferase